MKIYKSILVIFLVGSFCTAAEIKLPHKAELIEDFKTWHENNTTKKKIENNNALSAVEQQRMNRELSRRTRIAEDLLNNITVAQVTKKIPKKIPQTNFENYEFLAANFIKPFNKGIQVDFLDFEQFIKTFQENVSFEKIKSHISKVNDSAYALALLGEIRKFLYEFYDGIKKAASNENSKLKESLSKLQKEILTLLEKIDTQSIYWFKKRYPTFAIVILGDDIKTNKEEKQKLGQFQEEFKQLKKMHQDNVVLAKNLQKRKDSVAKLENQKIKAEKLNELEPDFKRLSDLQKNTKEKYDKLKANVEILFQDLTNKNSRYKSWQGYKGNYPTLFDALTYLYSQEIAKTSDNTFAPHQAYQALGLLFWATPDEVKTAYNPTKDPQVARNASNLLNLPGGKQTYDVFLDDFLILLRLGIDPYFPIKSKALQNFLNTEGQLSRLELQKHVADEIDTNGSQDNLIYKISNFLQELGQFELN